jgi:hypothetical protein
VSKVESGIMSSNVNTTDIQIKTWSVQRTLEPLVAEVCFFEKKISLI